MPIYAPGRRDRHNRPLRNRKRSIVAILSLTAMVDMFTVLTVFLLQNYRTTGEVIYLPKEVKLPDATQVKELEPAHVVTISPEAILVDKTVVATFKEVKGQPSWMIDNLYQNLNVAFAKEKEQEQKLGKRVKEMIRNANNPQPRKEKGKRVTVQADKDVDFLTVKKVMFTVTEAGASEINFAVIKDESGGAPSTN